MSGSSRQGDRFMLRKGKYAVTHPHTPLFTQGLHSSQLCMFDFGRFFLHQMLFLTPSRNYLCFFPRIFCLLVKCVNHYTMEPLQQGKKTTKTKDQDTFEAHNTYDKTFKHDWASVSWKAANGYELETPDRVADDDYPIQIVLLQVSSCYQGVFPSFGHQLFAHRGLSVTWSAVLRTRRRPKCRTRAFIARCSNKVKIMHPTNTI